MISGIYMITNITDGKRYIGSSIRIATRRQEHFANLRKGIHCNIHLQRAYNRDGRESFTFETLEIVSEEVKLIEREQFYIDSLHPEYNLAQVAGSTIGYRHTEETKARWKERRIPVTEELRRKRSENAKRRWQDPDYQAFMLPHISTATHKRRPITEETRENMRKAAQIRNNDPQWKQHQSEAQKGRKQPPEQVAKTAASLKRVLSTPEARQRKRDAAYKSWQARRENAKKAMKAGEDNDE